MPDPHIAPFLPGAIWRALQAISQYADTLPISEHETRSIHRGIETLTEKFVMISKQHHLHYPIED